MANACFHVATARLGLSVPEELSFVVFGEGYESVFPQRRLAACLIPWRAIGKAAVEMLDRKIDDPSASLASRAVEHEWVEGETLAVAPVPAEGAGRVA
jgi:DNA-binding LacI/PurR family transcriptional regulator